MEKAPEDEAAVTVLMVNRYARPGFAPYLWGVHFPNSNEARYLSDSAPDAVRAAAIHLCRLWHSELKLEKSAVRARLEELLDLALYQVYSDEAQ